MVLEKVPLVLEEVLWLHNVVLMVPGNVVVIFEKISVIIMELQ